MMSEATFCNDCTLANWKRTASGRLHPDRTGRCGAQIPEIALPAAFYWIGIGSSSPRPMGGFIERGKAIPRPCPYKKTSGSRS